MVLGSLRVLGVMLRGIQNDTFNLFWTTFKKRIFKFEPVILCNIILALKAETCIDTKENW